MPVWGQYAAAIALVLLIAPFVAGLARGSARRTRGGMALAALMLGFGEAADPPSKHAIEAATPEEKEAPAPGDPPSRT